MNKLISKLNEQKTLIIFSLLIFAWFYTISSKTPLAGDDWAFHNNAMSSGILNSAFGMYYGWEGRLMTLISMHLLILHRNLWEVVNALIYPIIFILGAAIIKPKQKLIYSIIFLLLAITIKDNIRMEVFTWITGSIYYGIPLLLSVVYFSVNYIIFTKRIKSVPIIMWILSLGAAFYLPLGMENIAIACLTFNLFLNIQYVLVNRKLSLFHSVNLLFFIVSYAIWMNSPGSSIRLDQMPQWQELSLIGKVLHNMPHVLFFTFYQNKYLILLLNITLIIFNWQKFDDIKKWIFIPVYAFSIMLMFSQRFVGLLPDLGLLTMMADGYSVLNVVFWLVYAIVLILNVIIHDVQLGAIKYTPFLIIAVFASVSLLMSPVIGYRLMVYSFFYLSLMLLMILDKLDWNVRIKYPVLLIASLLIFSSGRTLYQKYTIVQSISNERNAILQDYAQYFDQYKDGIWLPRYPIYSIHGGDIEVEDEYHMKAFKTYHNIPRNETIIFYWKESY